MVRKLEVNREEICDQAKINEETKIFFEEAFKYHKGKSFTNLSNILDSTDLPCLTTEQNGLCELELSEKELSNALKSMLNDKTVGNYGLSNEIYKAL